MQRVVMSSARARALGLAPLARVVAQATSGLAPKLVLMTPVDAVRKVLAKAGWTLADVDLLELNEAFSVQALAVMRELDLETPPRPDDAADALAVAACDVHTALN